MNPWLFYKKKMIYFYLYNNDIERVKVVVEFMMNELNGGGKVITKCGRYFFLSYMKLDPFNY